MYLRFLLLFFISCASYAKDISLYDAYQKALSYDPTVAASRFENIAAQEEIKKSLSNFLPQVRMSLYEGQSTTDSNTIKDQKYDSKNYNLSVRQSILNLSNFASLKQSKSIELKSQVLKEKEDANLFVKISSVYIDTLLAKENLLLIENQINTISSQLDQTKKLFDAGRGTVTDIYENEANLNSIGARRIEALNVIKNYQYELKRYTGSTEENIFKLNNQDINLNFIENLSVDQWIEVALTSNIEILAAQEEINIAYYEVMKQKSQHLPTLDLIASKALTQSDTNFTIGQKYNTESIGLQLNIPLYQGGAVSANIRQSDARLEKYEEQLKGVRLAVESNTRKFYSDIIVGKEKIVALKKAVESNQSSLTGAQKGFEAGIKTNIETLMATEKLAQAQRDLLKERYQLIFNVIQFKQLMSQLNSYEIKIISDWFNIPTSQGN